MMDDRKLDLFTGDLFRAARGERPAPGAKDQVLASLLDAIEHDDTHDALRDEPDETRRPASLIERRGRRHAVWLWSAGTVTLAVAAGFSLWISSAPKRDWAIAPAPERIADAPSARHAPPAVAEASVRAAAPEPPRAAPSSSARPASSRALTLSEEVALLERARVAVRSRDAASALALLDSYERRPSVRLRDEAGLLRIEAVAIAGRSAEASELAARFIANNPNSTLAERARKYLDPKTTKGEEP
jgi:hypothetical protein